MHRQTHPLSLSWRARAREILARLLRPRHGPAHFVVWADMTPIDFEGEDSSLRERDLQLMK